MMHFGNRSVLALLPAAMLATGLVSAPAQAEDGVIRIGITLRMIVENGLKYGQMAKDELEAVNAIGGINGKKIEVILLDDECKPDKGIANVNRFIHQHKVHLVMGSTCSSVTMPMVDGAGGQLAIVPPPRPPLVRDLPADGSLQGKREDAL